MSEISTDAKAIFFEVIGREPHDAQLTYLDRACGQDIDLRHRVEALLRAHQSAGNFLGGPNPRHERLDQCIAEGPGAIIGPYKLMEQIGEGGMGLVFVAEQQYPVRRKVALKVIKPGMDTRRVIARFEAERQALALLDHPNIAHVLDAGTTPSGRPYFVMELVRGLPITEFCDQNGFTPRGRLDLFVNVCQAVQHAHQKGIIHRDLKPSNILVSLHDGVPVVKVIDFGVAKAIGQQLTEKTIYTRFAEMIGTPMYMSPEQAEMSGLDVDTRSDIYSMGVLLYELLTGVTPFDKGRLRTATLDEIRRIVREEEPLPPSKRISTLGETRTMVSAQRQSDPKQLSRLFRDELDWIVMKAIEKDRSRRYETASAFATDVRRYLHDEPVQACPPSIGYRVRKFALRNKGPVIAALLLALALVGGIIGTTWGMIRAQQARRSTQLAQFAEAERADGERRAKEEAQKRLAQVEKGTEFLARVFRNLHPMAAESEGVTLLDLLCQQLDTAAQQLEGEAVGDPLVTAQLQHVLGTSLRELGHLEQAEGVLVKACQTQERLLGANDTETLTTKHDLAMLYRDQGKYSAAEALYKEVLAARTGKLGTDHPDTLSTQHHLAILYHAQGKYTLAEPLYEKVLLTRTATLGAKHPDTLHSQHRLAMLYRNQGKFDLAEATYKEVLAARTGKLGTDHLDTIATKANLASLYMSESNYDLAEPLLAEVLAIRTAKLPKDHPDTITSKHHLAALHAARGNFDLAEPLFREVLAVRIAKLGPDHCDTLRTQSEIAMLYYFQGKNDLAEPMCKDVLELSTANLGPDHPLTIDNQHKLAVVYVALQRLDLSIPLLEEALKRRTDVLGYDHPTTLGTLIDLGNNYCNAQRFADAELVLMECYERLRQRATPIQPEQGHLVYDLESLVRLYEAWNKSDEAAKWRKELEALEKLQK